MQKFVVTNVDTNTEHVFYDQYKTKSDGEVVVATSGLDKAREKYKELRHENRSHKLTLTRMYPNYHTGQVMIDLLESNV